MESGPTEIAILQWLAAVGTVVTALSVGYIAHNEFGIPMREIRILVVIGASTIATLLAVEYFERKLRKSK